MSRRRPALPLALLLLLASARGDDAAHPWAPALAEAGLRVEDVRLDPGRWRGGGPLSLPTFDRLWDDPARVSPTALELGRALVRRPTLSRACSELPLEPGGPSWRGQRASLVAAVEGLQVWLGSPLSPAEVERLGADVAALPSSVQAAAGAIIGVAPLVTDETRAALVGWGDHPPAHVALALRLARYDVAPEGVERLRDVDAPRLLRAAAVLGLAIEYAQEALLASPPTTCGTWSWDTPLGRIIIAGTGDDAHDGARTLLLLDAGGNDRYSGGASAARGRVPVSVLIDVSGDDVYDARGEDAAFGAGILGIGALADLAGDDVYRARSASLGCGVFGVGMLLDVAGDDAYEVISNGQGAGTAGAGILIDRAGNDRYACVQRAQGFGQTRGAGLLLDVSGDDVYDADDTLITRPSPQTAEHNTSLAQGCGFGRRAHPGDERSLAGGVGLLVDGGGDDRYRCGVFGQGTAYWYALGFLVDLGGDDAYRGAYYAQGAAAHYAVAALVDVAGDDRHDVTLAQALGHGQDLSIGVLHDLEGDDRYAAPGHSMGAALWNGVGVLQDDGGRDVYRAGPRSLGDPGQDQCREGTPAFGLFVDLGGEADLPPGHPRARAGETWVIPGAGPHPRAIGVGRAAE